MAFSAHQQGCLKSVVKLKDDEATEILDRVGAIAKAEGISEDDALHKAVTQLVEELRGAKAPTKTQQRTNVMADVVAEVTGTPTERKVQANSVIKKANDEFLSRVDAAKTAGEINADQEQQLLDLALQGERGRVKAKDELLRMREDFADKKLGLGEAEKLWNDPDWMYQEGDPKFADLAPALQEKWAKAVKGEKTSIDLYDDIVKEQKGIDATPKVDTSGDVRPGMRQVNPDRVAPVGVIDHTLPEMQHAHTAALWLVQNAKDDFIAKVAAKLYPYLSGNIPITYLQVGQKYNLPTGVAAQLRSPSVFGLAVLMTDRSQHTYFKVDAAHPISESDLLHELLHNATQAAIEDPTNKNLTAELKAIQQAVARNLRNIGGDAHFFGGVVENPHELLAYAFSSPSLRHYLDQFLPTGEPRGLKEFYADREVNRQANRNFQAPEPTLWQRFVDWLANLFKLDKVFAPKIDALVKANEEAKLRFITENTAPTLYERLDKLLDQALESGLLSTGQSEVASRATAAAPAEPTRQKSTETTDVAKGLNLPDFEPGNPFATRLKDWMGGWRNNPKMLGWLTLRQIADRFKAVPGVQAFADLSQRMGTKAKTLMAEAHSIDQDWAKLKNDEALDVSKLMIETTLDQVWPDRPLNTQHPNVQNKPGIAAKHAGYARRYEAMNDTQKRVYQNVQAKMRKDWDERGRLLTLRIVDQYRAELASRFPGKRLDDMAHVAKAERGAALQGLTKNEQKSLTAMWGDLDSHAERLAQMPGPYFPLVRFGDHVVVAKSAEYTEAAEALSDARDRLEALNGDDDSTPRALEQAREAVQTAQREIEDLKDHERHYVVEFFESPTEARSREAQLKAYFASKGQPMQVYSERRVDHFQKLDAASPAFMKKLEDSLAANLPDKDAHAIRAAVRDLYIQSMPERSALKSQLRRMGVKGAKPTEMRRAFAAASMRGSWHLSRLEFGDAMQRELMALRNGESDEQRIVGGELGRRLVTSMQQDEGNLMLTQLSNLSYLTYLGMSPSFFIMNASQPWVISLPVMASKYGIKRSTAELGKAFNETAAAMTASARDQGTWRFELNLEEFGNVAERQMLSDLFNKGIIDVTIEHDLGSIAGGDDVSRFAKVMQLATLPAHHTEVVNRVMTALAAYRLAMSGDLGKPATQAEATSYAESVVADTHLDYTPENAPRFMRTAALGGLGRVVFQFKKYMQGMIFLTAKLAVDAARGDKEAGKGLAYLMGANLAVAGTAGLPLAAPLGMIFAAVAKLWPDDDEPEIAQLLYQGLQDMVGKTAARALVKGLPAAAGIDVSGRLGQGNILNPLAYTAPGKEGRDWVAASLLALAGPAASMVANWAEGLHTAHTDPVKGAMTALPKVIADPIRAMDRFNRGVTNKQGVELISPDEFGPLGLLMRSIGFESTDVTDMYDQRGAFMNMKTKRDDARKAIISDYAAAAKNGADTTDVSERASDYSERHPDTRITAQSLRAAVEARRAQQKQMVGGIQVRRQDRELAAELGVSPQQ